VSWLKKTFKVRDFFVGEDESLYESLWLGTRVEYIDPFRWHPTAELVERLKDASVLYDECHQMMANCSTHGI
jgi:hypothetical protein